MNTIQTLTATEIDHVAGGLTLSLGTVISTDAVVNGLYSAGKTFASSAAAVGGALVSAGTATYNSLADVTADLGTSIIVTGGVSK